MIRAMACAFVVLAAVAAPPGLSSLWLLQAAVGGLFERRA